MAIELDNLKVEQVMNKDGDMVYHVFDTDIDEILFSANNFESAINFAENKQRSINYSKGEA